MTTSSFGSGSENASLTASDVLLRKNAGTWIKLEQSTSKGLSNTTLTSNDGGFNFQDPALLNTTSTATANRIDASVNFNDVIDGLKGKATVYSQTLNAGYSSPGLSAQTKTLQSGGTVEYTVIDDLKLKLKLDEKKQDLGLTTSALELDADYKINDNWAIAAGV